MPERFTRDRLYARMLDKLVDFSFDEKTIAVFPDMINRSVPGYSLLQSLTGLVASGAVTENSRVFDLGCSLGASSLSVLASVDHARFTLVMIDSSKVMIDRADRLLREHRAGPRIEMQVQDIRQARIENASMVMLNLVLQFLPVADRQAVLSGIYSGLNENGVLLLAEKIGMDDDPGQQVIEGLHHDFKKRSGYSDLEIGQKRQALENVMQSESLDTHIGRLESAGFSLVVPLFRALNFAALMAVK